MRQRRFRSQKQLESVQTVTIGTKIEQHQKRQVRDGDWRAVCQERYCVEDCRTNEQPQQRIVALVKSSGKIIYDFQKSCFGAVARAVSRLMRVEQIIIFEVFRKLERDNFSVTFEGNDRLETDL